VSLRHGIVVMVALAVFGPAHRVSARQWFVVESKNFRLYSDGKVEDVQQLALKLERFRQLVARLYKLPPASEPISIVAFQNPSVFAKFRPDLGRHRVTLGYKMNAGIEDMVAMALYDRDRMTPLVLFHETFHALTQAGEHGWPNWLEEGAADVFGSFEERDGSAILGIPRLDHVKALRRSGLIPMERFLSGKADDSPVFYPQSWALTHWLTCADRGARLDQLREFMRRLREGEDDADAFQQAFSLSPAAIQKELQAYIRNDEFPMWQFPLSVVAPESSALTNSPISDARRDCIFGNLVLSDQDVKRAEYHFKQATTEDPDLAAAWEGLGFVEALQDRLAQARQHFEQAFARKTTNYRAYYYYALVLYAQHAPERFFAESVPRETAIAMADALKKAIELRPTFANAYELLARLTLNAGEDPHEGLKLVHRALEFEPGHPWFRLTKVKLQIRVGDYDAARQSLQPLLGRVRNSVLKKEASALNEELRKVSAVD
jgi:tetratricopeptide (TPR) repeat protein